MRFLDERADLVLLGVCGVLLALALAVAARDSAPHSHDGGRTWHAHVGGSR